ncbi:MAG: polymerase [Bacteroidetes bacterium]|nr:polymerase [Bacteroidota bacterium]
MKLFLLDAYALIYRSYYAFIKSPRVNSKGQNTSAIFGFVNTLEELLKKENPSHIAVAFDPPGKTFRHEAYEAYKAQREATPEDIKFAVPYIKNIIEAYNIKLVEVSGYEADDVIGTLSKMAEKENFEVFMMTPDKDYGQLTSNKIQIYKPKYGDSGFEVLNDEAVMNKYGLSSPLQMIDYLGLMGDASDNIPGCPGVGPKTAQKLLADYHSIEGIYEYLSEVKGSVKTKLEENKDQVFFSKFLATIKTDVPIEFNAQEFLKEEINEEKLRTIFEELEFRTLLQRIFPNEKSSEKQAKNDPYQTNLFAEFEANPTEEKIYSNLSDLKSINHNYYLIENEIEIDELIGKIHAQKFCSFDTETTGIDPLISNLVGMSFSLVKNEGYYLPVPQDFEIAKKLVEKFKDILESDQILKIGQNIKYDMLVLRKYGIVLDGPIFDTMIAHYLLNPELRHNMDYLAETYLKYQTIHIDELIGPRGKNQKNMSQLDPSQIVDYASEDADITLQLKEIFEKEIEKNQLNHLLYEIELPLLKVLCEMEFNGVRVDKNALQESSIVLTNKLQEVEKEIIDLAGYEFNINSARQVGEVLFERLRVIEKAKKTKTGQYTTSEETLEAIKDKHPIINKILKYRGLKKLLSTYIDALPELINPETGKIHTSFNQATTATGRLSSTNPNLQNIPIRDEEGREIRRAFIPDKGCTFLSVDYSQIELRIMAHLSQDPSMIEAFVEDQDIHAATAAKIYKLDINQVTKDMRRKAKTANFGIIYGISVFGLADRLTIPRSEAKELIEGYFATYPRVKKYMDESIQIAKSKGYVETIFGRKRFLPDINSKNAIVRGYAERNAINAPIQGSAADIIKVAMVNIAKRFKKENIRSKMILQVHDELNFSVFNEELSHVEQVVKEEMENAIQLLVPLRVDAGIGQNWLEAH